MQQDPQHRRSEHGIAGLPSFVRGSGPPLVYLPGLAYRHETPQGASQVFESLQLRPLRARFTVHWVGRRPAVAADCTISDHARDVASLIQDRFDGPVPVAGFSTGGFVSLQLAIDRPDLVSRLVVIGAGCRLSAEGRSSGRRWADALEQGRTGDAWREVSADLVSVPILAQAVSPALAIFGRIATPGDCTDGIRTARAELDFDVCSSLGAIAAPTMLITGMRDRNCPPELAAATRARIPDAGLLQLPNVGHTGSLLHPRALRAAAQFLSG